MTTYKFGDKAMSKEIEKGRVGGAFSDFLKEQGSYEETTEQAVKRVIAHQLANAMKESGINKTVIYVAKFADAIYVLHCFQKKRKKPVRWT
jgi:phage-related protein